MKKTCVGASILAVGLSLMGHAATLTVTNGLTLHFRADSGVYSNDVGTIPATDGSTVGMWSNVGYYAGGSLISPDGSGLQPTYHTGVLNGLPVVRFDGSDDRMTAGLAFTSFLGLSSWTIFAVFEADSVSATGPEGYNSQAIFMDSGGNVGMPVRSASGVPKVMAYSYTGAAYPPAQTFNTNQFTFAVATLGGGLVSIQSAGAGSATTGTVTSAAGGNTAGSGLRVGMGSGSQWLDGDIAELLFYNRTLAADEWLSVTSYLNTKYALGLLAPLPPRGTMVLIH